FNDVSSARFVDSGPVKRMMQGMPMIGGPQHVDIERGPREGGVVLRASHDGYADEFGVIHHRAILLSADGLRVDGEDLFTPAQGNAIPTGHDQFAMRFHLHPAVKANRLTDSHGAMLLLPNKEVWTFNAYEDRIDIEESVFLAATEGPRRTSQIVIHGRARKVSRVQWTFSYVAAGVTPGTARRLRGEEPPQLPL